MTEKEGPRFPISEALEVAQDLVEKLKIACTRIEIAGSIRRIRPDVGDIELVAVPKIETVVRNRNEGGLFPDPGPVQWNYLFEALDGLIEGWIGDFILKGDRHRRFVWPVDLERSIPVDVFMCDRSNWGNIFLIRTGSREFAKDVIGKRLRGRGFCSKGGRIYHLVADKPWGDPITVLEEADVFRLAHMEPVAPSARNL